MLIDRILDPVILTLLFALMAETKPTGASKPRHLVPSIPGIVTVFIRPGDTPLQDINRDLAEAFDFNAVKHGRVAFGREINAIINEREKTKKSFNTPDLKNVNDLTLIEETIPNLSNEAKTRESHVQKIPKH